MNRNKVALLTVALLATLFVQPMAVSQAASGHQKQAHYYPTVANASFAAGSPAAGVGAVTYHQGGAVISNPNVYLI